jgi:hypothetical protein
MESHASLGGMRRIQIRLAPKTTNLLASPSASDFSHEGVSGRYGPSAHIVFLWVFVLQQKNFPQGASETNGQKKPAFHCPVRTVQGRPESP